MYPLQNLTKIARIFLLSVIGIADNMRIVHWIAIGLTFYQHQATLQIKNERFAGLNIP